jgi:transcriptional regulator of acetoin/glycerol metabolism
MTPREKTAALPPLVPFAPLGQAVIESLSDGVVVFDAYGRLVYANETARRMAGIEGDAERADALRPRLLSLGGRAAPLRSGAAQLGEAVFLPADEEPRTLADRERQAIIDTLKGTSGRLAETARRLGISRTTLWRRLKAYGLRPGNGQGGSSGRP